MRARVFEIRLLGAPEFVNAGAPFRFSAPPRTLPLLAWLLLNRRAPHARDALAFAFWPDAPEDEARGDLRRHLYYLSKALPPHDGAAWIVADKKTVAWNANAPATIDVAEFERLCAGDRLEDAVRLYRGRLLAGAEDEWLEPERERLETLAVNAYLQLIGRDFEAAPQRAIEYAQRLLRIDPWREDAVRALVELRHRTGDRAGALQEYREFAARLRAELDVEPMPETTAVYDAIAQGAARVVVAQTPAFLPHTNLPSRSESLVGRGEPLAHVRALLATTRIATLTGTGGVGKTRLALEAGWEALRDYPDGVWFADCGPLADPTLVVGAVAAAVGIAQATERPESASVVASLRRKHLLLIVDNCEHVVAEVARLVAELVAACPEVRVLATSREPLAVRGERVFKVPSLDVPPDFEPQTPQGARAFGAVALFELRASAASPAFALRPSNLAVVVDICRRLDGIALAIELAAARITVLSPEELLRRLEERFRVLTGGERTALPRQRTMRALIDWSWDLCSPVEQTLLRRFGIFHGGWNAEAAEAVCCAPPVERREAFELSAALVEKSLVVADAQASQTRYRLLESIRHYMLERLREAGEFAPLARRHAEHFARFGERIDAGYETLPDREWYALATCELDDVRAALAWALGEGGDAALGAALASAYGRVWEYGSSRADRRWLDLAYERLDRAAYPALTARLLWQISSISHAEPQHAQWVEIAVRDRGDRRTRAESLCWLAEVCVRAQRFDAADAALADAEALDDPVRRPKAHVALLRVRAELAAARGDSATARALLERAIAGGSACGAAALVAAARVALAEVAFAAGDVSGAARVAVEARAALGAAFGRTIAYADATGNLAAYEIAAGGLEAAERYAREAIDVARDLDFPGRIVAFVEHAATIAGLRGESERAAFLLGFTDAERRRRGAARGRTELAGYERLVALLRAAFDEAELAKQLARGAIAGLDRAVGAALGEGPETPER